jgi:copper transport protein
VASPAVAHPTLLATAPEAGYAVETAPDHVTLVFDEPVQAGPRAVRVLDDGGEPVRTSEVAREQGGRRLVVRLLEEPDPGRYVVRWRVTAQDGDVVDSAFDFAVATSDGELRGREDAQTAGLPLVAFLRWVLFVGLVGALGGRVGEWLTRRTLPDVDPVRSLVRPSALVGLVAAVGLLVHLAVTAGSARAVLLLAVAAGGFAVAAALASARRAWLVVPPLGAVVLAEAWRNHLGTQGGAVGATVVAVHLAAVAVWVGALVHVLRMARAVRGPGSGIRRLVGAYARMALGLFLVVVATGTVGALLLVPSLDALVGTAYGRVLLGKLTLVAGVAVLALAARRRLTRGGWPLGRAASVERGTLVAVLAASAVLVSLPTPAPATQDLGFPLPVSGPVVRLGTLAGHVSVGVAASENQLELRLRVPDDQVRLGEAPPPPFRVAARVSTAAVSGAAVALRPCGPGCFVGPVQWSSGVNHLDVRFDAPGWHGGAAVMAIPWPPRVERDVLVRVVETMRAEQSFELVETVTSDTSRAAPPAQTVTLDGPYFLDSEPYGDSPDMDVVVLDRVDGRTVVGFGLPAEGVHVRLELDESYRIVAETLAAPKHLVQRTFTYPED